jgi:hypothetical protein
MTRRDRPLLTALGLLVLFMALVLVAPGAVVTFAVERLLRLRFDLTQRWTWAVASSVVLACVMALRSRDKLGRYALLAAVASTAVVMARFGMHARWAAEMLREYVP